MFLNITEIAVQVHRFGISVSELDEFQKELLEKKYKYSRPGIQDQSWGTRDMTIGDPFGNKLIFTNETSS